MSLLTIRLHGSVEDDPAVGAVEVTPLQRVVKPGPSRIVTEETRTYPLTDGVAAVAVPLAPCYLRIREWIPRGRVRHVWMPSSDVDYADLADVDPTSLAADIDGGAAATTYPADIDGGEA